MVAALVQLNVFHLRTTGALIQHLKEGKEEDGGRMAKTDGKTDGPLQWSASGRTTDAGRAGCSDDGRHDELEAVNHFFESLARR